MTDKSQLILQYLQKKDVLSVSNSAYQNHLTSLFQWLIQSDDVKHDRTTKYLMLPQKSYAKIIAKDHGIVAGIEEILFLLNKYSTLTFTPKTYDGKEVKINEIIGEISGNTNELFGVERTVLNLLQRMSGIATKTNDLISIIHLQLTTYNLQPFIAATRKTPWMWLDKKAVAVGGGLTHRLSLSDGILIKDNHLISLKNKHKVHSNQEAVIKGLKVILSKISNQLLEIEVETIEEAVTAVALFHKLNSTSNHLAILLDNFSALDINKTLHKISQQFNIEEIIFEASGGIDEKNIQEFAKTGIDIISLGSLTHSSKSLNLSLEIL